MKIVTDFDILIGLLGRKRTRIAKEIDEANSNTTIDIQDQLVTSASANFLSLERANAEGNTHGVLFRGRHLLYGQRIVKQ